MTSKIKLNANASPAIFRLAQTLRRNRTKEELILWEWISKNQLGVKFRQQHPFYKYVLDFYCHELKLAIEIDGGNHDSKIQTEKDMERTRRLSEFGVKELRFTNDEVNSYIEEVVETIRTRIEKERKN